MTEIRPTIKVLYSCRVCGLNNQEVDVTAREAEDVVAWMEQTCIVQLAQDHATRRPHCRPETLVDVKIPLSGNNRVGGATAQ